ncbi:MAG TPA: hypothetical protein P5571_13085, partial [Candidatus Krumholzibacteria bacterium]|nr:hypothetical protein [Candidatus Krumholzibacteria bacterium]HRX52296.1 hypothetical protein [Candidatus Krumholzibacteria bacterium]
MNDNPRFLSAKFSLRRTLILVAVIEAVLAVGLFVYYRAFQGEFFAYDINDDGSVTVEGKALLVGYGAPIPSPWTFTAVGQDTLLLNGLPFLPLRAQDDTWDMEPGERDRLITIRGILEEAQAAYETGDDKAQGRKFFTDVLVGYLGVFVDSVQVDDEAEQVTVDFVDDLPPFTVTFLRHPHWVEPEGARRKKHLDMIEEFVTWMSANDRGAVFSFGPYNTELVISAERRDAYDAVLAKLDTLADSPRGMPSETDIRRELGDEAFQEWHGLIRDYLCFHALHVAN